MMNNNDDSSDSSDDDFMSPFATLRTTFPTPKCESETLTAGKDSSFIGARLSPVAMMLDDDDEDINAAIAPYEKALHESMESSFSNERTSLLGRRAVSRKQWDEEPHVDSDRGAADNDGSESHQSKKREASKPSWGLVVCALSGIHLACMALHDLYVWYLSYRNNRQDETTWTLPLLSPTSKTLVRFGALVPTRVLEGEWWRLLTSSCMSTSLVEYLVICSAWYALLRGERSSLGCLYVFSTITGQLWTIAWDTSSISGGLLWGTCGVVCTTMIAKPRQRWLLPIVVSTFLILSSSLERKEPNSFLGILGSSTFGVAYYGSTSRSTEKEKGVVATWPVRMINVVVLLSLWLLPLLWIAVAFDSTNGESSQQNS